MTFVSALFSRTHLNANCFAVLNESFKVISLFSYQSSLLLSLRQLLYSIKSICLCQQLFYFSLLPFQATACLSYHRRSALSTAFFFPSRSFFKSDCRIPCRLSSLLFFCMCRRISDSLLIISPGFFFVNKKISTFFRFFTKEPHHLDAAL